MQENLTSLSAILDDVDQQKIFDIIEFLYLYNLHQSDPRFSNSPDLIRTMNSYFQTSCKMEEEDKEKQFEKNFKIILSRRNDDVQTKVTRAAHKDIPNSNQNINSVYYFNELNSIDQKNVMIFLYFLCYSKCKKISSYYLLELFNEMASEIQEILKNNYFDL